MQVMLIHICPTPEQMFHHFNYIIFTAFSACGFMEDQAVLEVGTILKRNINNGRIGVSNCCLEYCATVGDSRCVTVFVGWVWVRAEVGVCALGKGSPEDWIVFLNDASKKRVLLTSE